MIIDTDRLNILMIVKMLATLSDISISASDTKKILIECSTFFSITSALIKCNGSNMVCLLIRLYITPMLQGYSPTVYRFFFIPVCMNGWFFKVVHFRPIIKTLPTYHSNILSTVHHCKTTGEDEVNHANKIIERTQKLNANNRQPTSSILALSPGRQGRQAKHINASNRAPPVSAYQVRPHVLGRDVGANYCE